MAAGIVLVSGLATAGCSRQAESHGRGAVPIAGLAAVPATARAVMSVDVDRLASSPLVQRAVDQLLQRAPDLKARIERLSRECSIDVTGKVRRVTLALGDPDQLQVLLIATGTLTEADLAQCLTRVVGAGGGAMTARPFADRTLYQIKEGNRTLHFAFGQADTVVLSPSEPWLIDALGTGKKVGDDPSMREVLARAQSKAPMWATGLIDPRIGAGLVKASGGQLAAGPDSVFASMDPTSGLHAELGAVLRSEQDAKALESLAKKETGLLSLAAQIKGMGRLAAKVTVRRAGTVVRFAITLSPNELNDVLKAIDTAASAEQDAPPAAPSAGAGVDARSSGD